jgi:hypothetical protein
MLNSTICCRRRYKFWVIIVVRRDLCHLPHVNPALAAVLRRPKRLTLCQPLAAHWRGSREEGTLPILCGFPGENYVTEAGAPCSSTKKAARERETIAGRKLMQGVDRDCPK